MALYLGSENVQINLGGKMYYLNLFTAEPVLSAIRLLSSDSYILTDSNGVYLMIKEDE